MERSDITPRKISKPDGNDPAKFEKVETGEPNPKQAIGDMGKNFWKETRFGRTLTGRNKTGQILAEVKNGLLASTPYRDLANIPGKALGIVNGKESTESINDAVTKLPDSWRKYIRTGVAVTAWALLVYAFISGDLSLSDLIAITKSL